MTAQGVQPGSTASPCQPTRCNVNSRLSKKIASVPGNNWAVSFGCIPPRWPDVMSRETGGKVVNVPQNCSVSNKHGSQSSGKQSTASVPGCYWANNGRAMAVLDTPVGQ